MHGSSRQRGVGRSVFTGSISVTSVLCCLAAPTFPLLYCHACRIYAAHLSFVQCSFRCYFHPLSCEEVLDLCVNHQ